MTKHMETGIMLSFLVVESDMSFGRGYNTIRLSGCGGIRLRLLQMTNTITDFYQNLNLVSNQV